MVKFSYYKGGGPGGGGAFGKNSLTDAQFESGLPAFADAMLGSMVGADYGATAQEIAKAKLKLKMGGLPGYNPLDFVNVKPKNKVPQITINLKKKVIQAITNSQKYKAATTSTSSGGSKSSNYGAGGYSSSYGAGGYQGGVYGGAGGASIGLGVGGAFKNR